MLYTYFEEIRESVVAGLDITKEVTEEEIYNLIDDSICKKSKEVFISLSEKEKLRDKIYKSIKGFGPLEILLNDPDITEIMINGASNIFIEKKGKINKYKDSSLSEKLLMNIIQSIVSKVNRRVNESCPIVDTRLEDGSRVNIVLKPIALNGPVITIRKFLNERIDINKLIEMGSITEEAAEFINLLVKSKYNIFVSGGTGSGKTTFLNILSNFINSDERIITIEDSAELQIKGIENLVSLEVRQENAEGENGISIRDLIKTSLRMRPDRIIVGEVRGEEAVDMLSSLNTGHDGSMSTGHANSSVDMLSRLETMVLMGMDIPITAIRSQISSALDIIVHLGRMRDKSRKVLEISEIGNVKNNEIEINTLYKYVESVDSKDVVKGKLEWTNNGLKNVSKLLSAGYKKEAMLYGDKRENRQ